MKIIHSTINKKALFTFFNPSIGLIQIYIILNKKLG